MADQETLAEGQDFHSAGSTVAEINRDFYDVLWAATPFEGPERFNTWPLASTLAMVSPHRLEIGAGLRPRLPVPGTHFVDLSPRAVDQLRAHGGLALVAELTALPYPDHEFDLVAAFDVIEHVEDDRVAFRELSRVLRVGGVLVFSVPLHEAAWTEFDRAVGHARRYEPAVLQGLLYAHGLAVERSTGFGLQPNHPRLLKAGVRWMERHPGKAMWWYRWVFAPLGLLFQRRLRIAEGFLDTEGVHEALFVCRRVARPGAA